MNVYREIDKIFSREDMLDEAANPKDPSGERELFVNETTNKAAQYLNWGVITRQEYQKVKDFMKKTIKF
jgi:hypothetical protein